MTRHLHFDSVGGASGDMLLAALIDLGIPVDKLNATLARLGLGPAKLAIHAEPAVDHGLQGTRVTVHAHEPAIHGHNHTHAPHRGLPEIRRLIESSDLPPAISTRALTVFTRLAEAESRIHGTTTDKVHFHEVGALDAIADIVGACAALEELQVHGVSVGPLPLGHGTVTCAHGVLPIPAPATVVLLTGMATAYADEPFEMVTPTGAALLSTWRTTEAPPDGARLAGCGVGLGHRALAGRPNLLRAILFEIPDTASSATETCLVLETNLDDTTPELIGALIPSLLKAGAWDAFVIPVQMKKQRPGMLVTVLSAPARREALLDVLFKETTTFGVRERLCQRTTLERQIETVATAYGPVRIKIGRWRGAVVTRAPEYDDCRTCAEAGGVAVRAVYEAACAAAAATAVREP
ncbi:MAG: nickel pincer cofactor biosynthesis protein LarC [bacterium]